MRRARIGLIVLAIGGGAWFPSGPCAAQTSYPMTMRIEPVAVQRGRTVELTVAGRESFDGASALLCQAPGLRGAVLKVEVVDRPPARARPGARRRATPQVRARLEVAPEAPLGPREVRVATPQGVSTVGLVVVVDDPVVVEADDQANDHPETAQKLSVPAVAAGRIGKLEDVDWYSFEAEKGQWISFEVWANRLENKIHDLQKHFDPILSVHDARGRKLVVADNTYAGDPLLSFRAPAGGAYFLEIRDTTYSGDVSWCYALHAMKGPVATSVAPMAVNPGTTARVEVCGPGFDLPRTIALPVPKGLEPGRHLVSLAGAGGGARPVPLVVTPHPVVVESADAPDDGDPARPVTLPAALCGRLDQPGDKDGYRFPARKGTPYAFEVLASRAGSDCDPVLRVLDPKGAIVVESDDTRGLGKDSRLEWTAPADGPYRLQVADLHDRGGPTFGYVLDAEPAHPDFVLTCDPDKINVGPGGRVPVFVRVARRHGFKGAVTLGWEGLPAGVTASPLTVGPAMTEGEIVVSAAPQATHAAALVRLQGTGQGPDGPIVRAATPQEEIYIPGGGRGRYPVETLALAVTDPSDITVEAMPQEVVLTPGESVPLEVTVTRHPRYTQPVNLAIVLQHLGGVHANPLPPGVTVKEAGSKTLLGPGQTKGRIILQAAPDAPACDRVPIAVMGHVSINFVVKTAYASAPVRVTVRPRRAGTTP
ncbi:MAG TPA: PPC domain-containing protein [Isosphaeraceae bacterium]|nr:PPC domain-containing protein [Isosphaeraceae bacterium]